jgi:hypothetical protein
MLVSKVETDRESKDSGNKGSNDDNKIFLNLNLSL